jgi:hypothetical protein
MSDEEIKRLARERAARRRESMKKWRDKNPDYGKNYMRKKRAGPNPKKKRANP